MLKDFCHVWNSFQLNYFSWFDWITRVDMTECFDPAESVEFYLWLYYIQQSSSVCKHSGTRNNNERYCCRSCILGEVFFIELYIILILLIYEQLHPNYYNSWRSIGNSNRKLAPTPATGVAGGAGRSEEASA